MNTRLKDILSLFPKKEIRTISGKKGLTRFVTWPLPVYGTEFQREISGGELLIFSPREQETLTAEILALGISHNTAGILVCAKDSACILPEAAQAAEEAEYSIILFTGICKPISVLNKIGTFIALNRNKSKGMEGFTEILLYGAMEERIQAVQMAKGYGYQTGCPYYAVVVEEQKTPLLKEEAEEAFSPHICFLTLYDKLLQSKASIFYLFHEDKAIFLIPMGNETDIEKEQDELEAVNKTMLIHFPKHPFLIGIGRAYKEILNFSKSVAEAQDALSVLQKMKNGEQVLRYDELGLFGLISSLADISELHSYCSKYIGRLKEYDKNNELDILNTLEAYFKNNFNISKTARQLYLHRNTLLYRLDRISRLLGQNIETPYVMLNIINCIMLERYSGLDTP